MIHAVIDTNVLVSALLTSKSDAATVQVLEAISANWGQTPFVLFYLMSF